MTITDMTEKQWYDTWHYIGDRYEIGERTFLTKYGLYKAFVCAQDPDDELYTRLCLFAGQYDGLPSFTIACDPDHTREHDLLRATYAYFFAHMGKAEFMAMTGGV